MFLRKFNFAIPKFNISQYHKVFTFKTFNNRFSDTFFYLLHFRPSVLNVNTNHKTKSLNKSNFHLIMTFTNPVFNKIKFNDIFNKEICKIPLHSISFKCTFKYPVSLGRKIFN